MNQIDPVYALPSSLCKKRFNITFPFILRSSKWPSSFRFSNWYPVCIYPGPIVPHAPPFSPWFKHPINNAERYESSGQLRFMQYSLVPCFLGPQYHVLKHPQPVYLRLCDRPSTIPIQRTGQIIVLYIKVEVKVSL